VHAGPPGSFRRGHDPRAFESAAAQEYERVLATVPHDVFEALLDPGLAAEVGEEYLGRTRGIEYFAALCLLLELDRRFSPYYWTNVADRALPFVGLIEHTNFVEPERYGGRRFLYVANYLPHGHELLGLDAAALLARYEPGLRAVNPAFSRDWVERSWLHVEPAAQPIVTVGYGARIPPLRTPAAGLVLANTTQVYPEDRGTNYAVRLGEQAARAVLDPSGSTG
jgi:protoporphyrinogen oxidase